jgi:Xaa-Pro aminopeptidase
MFDMGAVYGGYCSDQATTIFLGTPTKEQQDLITLAGEVYETTLKQIRPGMRACDIDAIAREKYAKSALVGVHLAHMVGHGVGLEFHDIPLIKPHVETVIVPGMTFTFEPAVRYPGVGAVRYEKVFHVTKDGLEML